jgi:hypothetical protein
MATNTPRVEVLSFAGCPHTGPAIQLVERVAAELGIEPDLRRIDVQDEEQAKQLRFLGSPSIRVNGRDIERGADERVDYVFSCRVYRSESGLTGAPDERSVREALQQDR